MTKAKGDNSLIYLKDEPIKLKESPIVDTITEELKNNKDRYIFLGMQTDSRSIYKNRLGAVKQYLHLIFRLIFSIVQQHLL